MTEVLFGRVKNHFHARGFGFLEPDKPLSGYPNRTTLFFHHSAIVGPEYHDFSPGDLVSFHLEQTPRGPQALAVTPISEEALQILNSRLPFDREDLVTAPGTNALF